MNQTEIFLNIAKRLRNINSHHVSIELQQDIMLNNQAEQGENLSLHGIYSNVPQAFRLHFTINGLQGSAYSDSKAFYFVNEDENEIERISKDDQREFFQTFQLSKVFTEMDKLIVYADDMELIEKENEYVFSLDSQKHSSLFFIECENEMKRKVSSMKLQSLFYEFKADRHFNLKSLKCMVKTIDDGTSEDTFSTNTTFETYLSDYNQYDTITIPDHIIEKANE